MLFVRMYEGIYFPASAVQPCIGGHNKLWSHLALRAAEALSVLSSVMLPLVTVLSAHQLLPKHLLLEQTHILTLISHVQLLMRYFICLALRLRRI